MVNPDGIATFLSSVITYNSTNPFHTIIIRMSASVNPRLTGS